MIRCSSRAAGRDRLRRDHLLLASGLALVLSALPVSIGTDGPALGWQAAMAKSDHGGDGPGSDNGGGHGRGGGNGDNGRDVSERGGPDHGAGSRGHDRGHDGEAAGRNGYHDLDEVLDSVRSGKAIGLERQDERIAKARDRYQKALGEASGGRHGRGSDEGIDAAGQRFSPAETKALMARGWQGPSASTDGFRNHGERVRTMVELAKRLGYGARVGAMQASFGTPYENDIAALQTELAEARAAGDEPEVIERLEAKLAKAIEDAKPGNGPDDSWATADLDVNDDGVVDKLDLEELDQTDGDDGGNDDSAG